MAFCLGTLEDGGMRSSMINFENDFVTVKLENSNEELLMRPTNHWKKTLYFYPTGLFEDKSKCSLSRVNPGKLVSEMRRLTFLQLKMNFCILMKAALNFILISSASVAAV